MPARNEGCGERAENGGQKSRDHEYRVRKRGTRKCGIWEGKSNNRMGHVLPPCGARERHVSQGHALSSGR